MFERTDFIAELWHNELRVNCRAEGWRIIDYIVFGEGEEPDFKGVVDYFKREGYAHVRLMKADGRFPNDYHVLGIMRRDCV